MRCKPKHQIFTKKMVDFACNRVMENDDDILMILSENKGEERYAPDKTGVDSLAPRVSKKFTGS